MADHSLTDEEAARRDELKAVASTLSLLLNPIPLARLRRLQGLVYGALDDLDHGRMDTAALVGLGPKAIDWARNRAKSAGGEVDIVTEYHSLLDPLLNRLGLPLS